MIYDLISKKGKIFVYFYLMKKFVVLVILIILVGSESFSQKVKYKDLYFMLNLRQFDQAEPFLRQFLADSKNDDHANAHYYMAEMQSEKAFALDQLKNTDRVTELLDSAILYYRKSLTFLDDKEVRRNDEYYQDYKRRDVRSGKFGIKLADVQLDYENKIKALEERKANLVELKKYFVLSQTAYENTQALYDSLHEIYPNDTKLFLQINDNGLKLIEEIKIAYNEAVENFKNYRSILDNVSRVGYDQSLIVNDIVEYNTDGKSKADFYSSQVSFWDYNKWERDVNERYTNDIIPIRQQLIDIDFQLESLLTELRQDSVDVSDKLPTVAIDLISEKLRIYDPEPLPELLFKYKTDYIDFQSFLIKNADYSDSSDLFYQFEVIQYISDELFEMDSLINELIGVNLLEEGNNYTTLIQTRFGSTDELAVYLKKGLDEMLDLKRKYDAAYDRLDERMKWAITTSDSLPLFFPDKPKDLLPIVVDSAQFTAGIRVLDSVNVRGYYADLNSMLVPEVYQELELDTTYLTVENIDMIDVDALVFDETDNPIHFVLFSSPLPEQLGRAATVASLSKDKINWVKNINLEFAPKEVQYNHAAGNLTIIYNLEGLEITPETRKSMILKANSGEPLE